MTDDRERNRTLDQAATDLAIAQRLNQSYRRVMLAILTGMGVGFSSVVGSIVLSVLGVGERGGPGPMLAWGFLGVLLFIASVIAAMLWYGSHHDKQGLGPADAVLKADLVYRRAGTQ